MLLVARVDPAMLLDSVSLRAGAPECKPPDARAPGPASDRARSQAVKARALRQRRRVLDAGTIVLLSFLGGGLGSAGTPPDARVVSTPVRLSLLLM